MNDVLLSKSLVLALGKAGFCSLQLQDQGPGPQCRANLAHVDRDPGHILE